MVRDLVADMAEWVDGRLIAGIYAAVSVPTERERQRLRRAGLAFIDVDMPPPSMADLDVSSDWVIKVASQNATALGGFAGLGGAASVPPEAIAIAVSVVRLAQRLAVVYGFDPETDRGQMALWRALQAGLDLDLPDGGPMGVRVTDLPGVLARRIPQKASVAVTRAVLRQSVWMVVGRLTRLLPVVSAGVAAVGGRRRMRTIGRRMTDVYRRLAEVAPPDPALIVDALEI
jgi:hypothetical protein